MNKKIEISKSLLKKLYYDDKLSMTKIGKVFDCNHATIVNRFKEYGWKSRGRLGNRVPIGITKDNLSRLYYKMHLSADKIARIIHHTKSGVESKMRSWGLEGRGNTGRVHFKYKKSNFDGDKVAMAYLIGFRLGDLNVYKRKTVIVVRCSSSIYQQAVLIRQLFSPYGGVSISRAQRGTYEVYCFVNNTFDFLLPKWEFAPDWILCEKPTFFSFLAGYSDAEGYFDKRRSGLRVSSQQKGIIFQCYECLNKLGFSCNKPIVVRRAGHIQKNGVVNNKDMWSFSIYRRSTVQKLMVELLPYIHHSHKRKAAAYIIKQLLSNS